MLKHFVTAACRFSPLSRSGAMGRQKQPSTSKESDPRESRIIWFDGEMTGLTLDKKLVEIACIITEADLTEVATLGPIVIHQSEEVIKGMSAWCKKTFRRNGLTKLIEESTRTEMDVDMELFAFLQQHTPYSKCPLAGNSVGQDRMFIEKYLPKSGGHLHYRTIDVSTIKELVKRWMPEKRSPEKNMAHRSLDDIRESIAELQYYRENVFVKE